MAQAPGMVRYQIHGTHGGEELVHTGWLEPYSGASPLTEADFAGPNLLSVLTQNDLNTIANSVGSAWAAFISSRSGSFDSSLKYDKVDVYRVDATGKATDQAEFMWPTASQPTGGSASVAPYALALCCTLRTGHPGRRRRGRLYLGGLAQLVVGSNGRTSSNVTTNFSTDLATFYRTLNGTTGLSSSARVVAAVNSAVGGFALPIQTVAVDDLFDWQSRRQDSLTSAWASSAV